MTDELREQLIQELLSMKRSPAKSDDLHYNRAILDVIAMIKSRRPVDIGGGLISL